MEDRGRRRTEGPEPGNCSPLPTDAASSCPPAATQQLQAGNEITAKGAKIAKSGPVIPTEVEESLSY
jgi:hypothetical protein